MLAMDPDGLLLDEKISAKLTEKKIEMHEYEDPVAFRYLYESRFRMGLSNKSLHLLVRVADNSLEHLPFDILQLGKRLKFSLSSLFPKMSAPIIKHLENAELDALYKVYNQYLGSISDNETCDFILRRVFKVAYDTINSEADLVRYLLSKHYQHKNYPEIIENYLIKQLKNQENFGDLPIENLIKSTDFFYTYLQDQWREFLDEQQKMSDAILDGRQMDGMYTPPTHPFLDPDVRRLLDNLFTEGKLKPVAGYNANRLPEWAKVGLIIDPIADEKRRIKNIIDILKDQVGAANKYQDWLKIVKVYSEMKDIILSLELAKGDPLVNEAFEIEAKIDNNFAEWMLQFYGSLRNLPYLPQPVMLHHIPHYLASQQHYKIALVVLDGMSYIQWTQIRKVMENENNKFIFKEKPIYAWVPTITSVSRQALFTGEIPMYFADSIDTATKEQAAWKLFWENQDIPKMYTVYEKSLGKGDYAPIESLQKPNIKVAGLVIDVLDELVHGSLQGYEGIYAEIKVWMKNGYLVQLLEDLISDGFEVYLTSDHGNKESIGIGRLSQGVLAETRGERVRIYKDPALWEETAAKYSSIKWSGDGLPDDIFVLLSQNNEAFIKEGETVVGHGSISLEEVIVPFVRVKKKNDSGEV
ncbi:MAG: hypothetical protein PWQ96_1773 [Clostridia bacterium]|nr:PglZ domain protein [Clostridiales bacterium]MDK2986129.1 hypothetical protein [Clostridia bacterium]